VARRDVSVDDMAGTIGIPTARTERRPRAVDTRRVYDGTTQRSERRQVFTREVTVVDDLDVRIPVGAKELEVIETYLNPLLD